MVSRETLEEHRKHLAKESIDEFMKREEWPGRLFSPELTHLRKLMGDCVVSDFDTDGIQAALSALTPLEARREVTTAGSVRVRLQEILDFRAENGDE